MINCNKAEILTSIEGITIPQKPTLRRMGYPGNIKHMGPQIESIFRGLIREAENLITPAGSHIILKIKQNNHKIVTFENSDFSIESSQVGKMLSNSVYVVIFTVTIGPGMEKKVKDFSEKDDMTSAFILDAIASETADAVADTLHYDLIKSKAAAEGYKVTPRFSPGYGDWEIRVQPEIIKICRSDSIGIRVNESSLMIPRKSVSAVFGLEIEGRS
jgi:cobalamin-dependent methionine synthase I